MLYISGALTDSTPTAFVQWNKLIIHLSNLTDQCLPPKSSTSRARATTARISQFERAQWPTSTTQFGSGYHTVTGVLAVAEIQATSRTLRWRATRHIHYSSARFQCSCILCFGGEGVFRGGRCSDLSRELQSRAWLH